MDAVDTAKSADAVTNLFKNSIAQAGFNVYVMCGLPDSQTEFRNRIIANGWPEEWLSIYLRDNLAKDDPVERHCLRTVEPFDWSNAPYDAENEPRVFVVRDRRGDQVQPRVESVIMAGTMEFGLIEGLSQFTIVMETWWVPRFQELGWNPRPLGVAVDINGMSCIGVTINVTEEAWRETCRKRAVDRPVLVWNGLDAPVLGLLEPALRQTG